MRNTAKLIFTFVTCLSTSFGYGQNLLDEQFSFNSRTGQRIVIDRNECPSLIQFRDKQLFDSWNEAIKNQKKARVFYEGRLALRDLKRDIEENLDWADEADGAYAIALAVKTTSDLIMDSLNVGASLTPPATRKVVATYVDIRRQLDEYAKNTAIDAMKKASPTTGAALQGLNVFRGNIQRIQELAKNGSLASTLSAELRRVDQELKRNHASLNQAYQQYKEVNDLKNAIDRACNSNNITIRNNLSTGGTNTNDVRIPLPISPNNTVSGGAVNQPQSRVAISPEWQADFARLPKTEARVAAWIDPLTPPKGPKTTCVKEAFTDVPSCASKWDSTGCSGPFGMKYGCPVVRCENKRVSACVGHKYQWQKMSCDLFVSAPNPGVAGDLIKKIVEDSAKEAAISTGISQALAAVATGGASLSAAISQFKITFYEVLKIKLKALGQSMAGNTESLNRIAALTAINPSAGMAAATLEDMGKLGINVRQSCGWTDWQ